MHRYFVINKPAGMVSQFVSPHKVGLLGDLDFHFPEGIHAVGRLDKDSEGLLILTTDKKVTRKLFLAKVPHLREYLVMVQNQVSNETLSLLRDGISIRIGPDDYHKARPISIDVIDDPVSIYPFAVDPREAYEHTWLLIKLDEGKFRQVRKMVLQARHRCLRLIRISISDLRLDGLKPGEVRELSAEDFNYFLGFS